MQLNARIKAGGHEPALFYARGVEWRSLTRYAEAVADFNRALELEPEFLPAHIDLAKLLALQGRFDEALKTAQNSIRLASRATPFLHAQCWAVLARVELARGGFREALAAISEALKLHAAGEIEWFLMQAAAHRRLGKEAEAIKDLKRGYDCSRSVVLRNAWLDALLEAGRGAEALPVIEAELGVRPLKSPWLIRRARARLSLKQLENAREDLRAALGELQQRISPEDPDITLVVERGMARLLLGDKLQAEQDLRLAKEKRAAPELLAPLESLLARERSIAEPPSE